MNNEIWCRTRRDSLGKTAIDNLMLRYRHIAPKPVTGDYASGQSQIRNNNLILTRRRPKRKYVRVCKNKKFDDSEDDGYNPKKKGIESSDQEGKDEGIVTTLQLLPVKSDLEEIGRTLETSPKDCISPGDMKTIPTGGSEAAQTVAESLVTVECVTGECEVGGSGMGSTDREIMGNLDQDACPAFISDVWNQVRWMNQAYKRLVTDGKGLSPSLAPVVSLAMKETIPCELGGAFTCRVKLQYSWNHVKHSKIIPCDAWRMEFGGFAWRLDTRAALSLGLPV